MEGLSPQELFLLAVASRHFGVSQECLLDTFDDHSEFGGGLTEFLNILLPGEQPPRIDRWQLEDGCAPRSSSSMLRDRQQSATADHRQMTADQVSTVAVASPRAPTQQTLERLSEVGDGESSSPPQLYAEQQSVRPQLFCDRTVKADQPVLADSAGTAFGGSPVSPRCQQPAGAVPPVEPAQFQLQQQPVGDDAAAARVQQQVS